MKSWTDEIPERYKQGLLDYEKAREVNQEFYISAEFSSPSIHPPLTFEIGDGKSYGNYENVALVKPNKYKIYTRAVTSDPKVSLYGKIFISVFSLISFLSGAPLPPKATERSSFAAKGHRAEHYCEGNLVTYRCEKFWLRTPARL